MYNRENLILEQYPFEVKQASKGRGVLICETSMGLKILKEYRGSEGRADFLYRLLQFLAEHGQGRVDCIVRTKEEKTLARDIDGTAYMVRDWYDSLPLENERHTKELKKVRNYITARKKKNDFEMEFLRSFDLFYKEAADVVALQRQIMEQSHDKADREGIYGICHGDYNQHNVIFWRQQIAVMNFEKASYDVQVADLGNFMRKILEKHNWNMGLGMDMLKAYNDIRRNSGR